MAEIAETVSEDYERGFKDGLKSECLKELKPFMVELTKGCTEAIKGITPMLIDKAQLTIRHPVNRRIPVEDALPENGVTVIFTINRGKPQIGCGYRIHREHEGMKLQRRFDKLSGLNFSDYDVKA